MDDTRHDPTSQKVSPAETVNLRPYDGRQKRFNFQVGDRLEYRVLRLFQYRGYFVRRGKLVFTTKQLDQATDIDVFAVGFDRDLNRHVVVAECKSGSDAGLDRVFWLAGLAKFVGAKRAILVRRPTRWNITDFARDVGVEILNTERLGEIERNLGILESHWPGVSDRQFFENHVKQWNAVIRNDDLLSELSLTYSAEFRFRDPFPAINFHVHHLRGLVSRFAKTAEPEERQLCSYLMVEAITQLSIFLMTLASRTKDLQQNDRERWIAEGLTYGDIDATLAHRILRHAYRVAEHTLIQFGIDRSKVQINEQYFQMPTPDYVDVMVDLVERLISNSHHAAELPALLDLILMERIVKGNTSRGWLPAVFPYRDLSRRVDLVRGMLDLLTAIGAFPKDALNTLFDSREAERPCETAPRVADYKGTGLADATNTEPTSPRQLSLAEVEVQESSD